MRIFRLIGLWLAGLSFSVLVACNSQTTTPTASTAPNGSPEAEHAGMNHGKKKINLNNALLSELDKLEGMLGIPALSNKIQASRTYSKPEELVSKNVLTQEQYDKIKDLVTVKDIVLTGEAKDLDYLVKLGLMKGHMYVAKELLDLGKPDQAEPHIGHPIEEIYADVEDQLKERGVQDFKMQLMALQALVKAGAKDKAKVNAEFTASMTAIDGAISKLPETQRKDPKFALQAVTGLLETAKDEYSAAIADGKIKEIIEYQDSRGFVIYAEELYEASSNTIPTLANQKIVAILKDLRSNWPEAIPPGKPVKTPDQISALVKSLETASQDVK
jgi:hypothetical protein